MIGLNYNQNFTVYNSTNVCLASNLISPRDQNEKLFDESFEESNPKSILDNKKITIRSRSNPMDKIKVKKKIEKIENMPLAYKDCSYVLKDVDFSQPLKPNDQELYAQLIVKVALEKDLKDSNSLFSKFWRNEDFAEMQFRKALESYIQNPSYKYASSENKLAVSKIVTETIRCLDSYKNELRRGRNHFSDYDPPQPKMKFDGTIISCRSLSKEAEKYRREKIDEHNNKNEYEKNKKNEIASGLLVIMFAVVMDRYYPRFIYSICLIQLIQSYKFFGFT